MAGLGSASRAGGLPPRAVMVTRPSEYEELLGRHATRSAAKFFLESRGRRIEPVEARHHTLLAAMHAASGAVPLHWRRARVRRGDLARFLFEPEDVVLAVGQDGLVANCAKYLSGQHVVGVNPDPGFYEGSLVRHAADDLAALLPEVVAGGCAVQARTMVQAELDDGQRIVALNELFIGHRSHQSARYRIARAGAEERHSSSGVIVATGTGATGWAKSVRRNRQCEVCLPRPEAPELAFFVREAWPSVATGTELTDGLLGAGEQLELTSELETGGVIFGDGIEADHLDFGWGRKALIGTARQELRLIV